MLEKSPVLFGEVLFDCFEDGSRMLGGAPFNVAWHLQAFGCKPLFISRVGDDPLARQIRDTMQHWGMTTAGLQKDSAHPTGEVKVTLRDGQPSFDIVSDRAYDHIQADAFPPMEPALIYHGSLGLRLPESATSLEYLLQKHPAPVFMDVNLRPPWWEREQLERLLDHASWVKINDDELETLIDGPDDIQAKAQTLLRRHDLTWVIITQGAKGAFILDNSNHLIATTPTAETKVVDTVGAGDAFASICIVGLLHDWSLPQIMQRAQLFASLLVGQRGATINDFATYRPLIDEWRLVYTHHGPASHGAFLR
jgi:fructokinase